MTNNYTTSTDAFADLTDDSIYGSSTDTRYATAMEGFIAVASRLIDLEVGRWEGFFYPSTDDVTFIYDGSGCDEQEIDEFVSITSVSVSEQGDLSSSDYTAWTENTDFYVYPYNHTAQGKPITKLIVSSNGTKPGWYSYRKAVKVVGVAGYSASVPSVIANACKVQAIRWFMRAKSAYQDVSGNTEVGTTNYKGATKLDPDVKLMLFPYKLELAR